MIISEAPFRISLGGGGTDLPSYYKKYEGFLISGAINKHIFVGANQQFYDTYSLKYSKIEIVKKKEDIKHKLIREAIKLLDIKPGIEITSLADIPSKTGLGSSGAFLISLLNTLHAYKGEKVSRRILAEEACRIELDILKEHEGKQDKYVSAFGGVKAYIFHKNGKVSVQPLRNTDLIISNLNDNLLLFFTGVRRKKMASDALKKQDTKLIQQNEDMINKMNSIKEIGLKAKKLLENEEFDSFGRLLDDHWEIKKQYSNQTNNSFIENIYKKALKIGAFGGKTIGAPGGGFLLFYVKNNYKFFIREMERMGLHYVSFRFEKEGVRKTTKERFYGI